MNDTLPRFLTRNSDTNTPTPIFFDPQLESVLGRGSFNEVSSARRYGHFLNDTRGSAGYAAGVHEAWGRLQVATTSYLSDADSRVMEREAEAALGSQKELTAFLDHANNSWLQNEVCAFPVTCKERILFSHLDAASGMWTVAISTARTVMTPHELREVGMDVRREVDDVFQQEAPFGNTVPRDELKDLVPDAIEIEIEYTC
eukprot:jgi/Tetstr1/433020/TSEL_022357.t1